MPTGRHRDGRSDGPWLERVVLSTPVGEWSTLRLVLSLLWIAAMAGLSASFVYDALILDHRGELVTAHVLRTNYDQRIDFALIALAPAGAVIAWARLNRLRRKRRNPDHPA